MKLCNVVQFFISSALDGHGEVPWFIRPHLKRCGNCADMWRNMSQVHRLLHEKGAELRHRTGYPMSVSPLAKAPGTQDAGRIRNGSWTGLLRPVMAMAAASLILVFGIRLLKSPPQDVRPFPEQAITGVKQQIGSLSATLSGTSLEDPLERELQGLIGTARTAAGYLRAKVKKATGLNDNGGQ